MNPTLVEGDMRYWRMQPDARLLPWVLCYYLVEPTAAAPISHNGQELLLPDGYSELVFKLDAPFERWDTHSHDAVSESDLSTNTVALHHPANR